MQLKLSFSTLLTGILVAFSANDVAAIPTKRGGAVTLPLKRVAQPQSDLHPLILHQQNLNRSVRRHARMAGRAEPTRRELEDNLIKRVADVEGAEGLAKRFNRNGVKGKRFNRGGVSRLNQFNSFKKGKGRGGKKNKAAAGAAGAAAGAGAAGAAGAAAASGSNSTATSDGSDDTNGVTAANKPATANSLGLDIEGNDVGYHAIVQIGNPPQDMAILMDSGSADLWVGSENCVSVDSNTGCGNHKFLGTQSSQTFVDTKKPFQVTYGTGAVAGTIIQDDISIAGLALKGHTFGVADQETDDFAADTVPFDGLMGLAQSTLSEQQTLTPVESLAKAGLIPAAITSFKISRLDDNKNDGEITFGALDETKFDPATLITVPNVNAQGFWEADMPAVTVDGKDTGLQGRTAILDTGTTLIVAPSDDATAIHAAIQGAQSVGQGTFTVPCDTTASVALTFDKTSFAIDPRDLAFAPLNDGSGDCISGISAGQIGGAQEWLVGDVFLKNAYFSTNVDKNTVSLAKLV